MLCRDPHELGEAAWVEIAFLELRTHRDVAVPTVMALETGNVMRHDHAISRVEFPDRTPDLNYLTGHLVAEDHGLRQRLKADLVNIRETDATGRDLE
jgi:hypothetical protein